MARQMKDSGVEWIGLIPDDWRIEKGKHVLSYLERPVEDTDGVVTCFRDGQVTLRSNRRELGYTVSLQEIGYKGVEPGDLVVHGMDGFAGAIGISDSRGKCSPVLNILGSDENKTFLMYYLRMMAYGNVFLALSTGIRERTCDTNWNKMKNLPYPVPSYEEQARIAAFLDTKCAEIDKVVEQTRATIEEYKKLKQAIITEAVTKGVRGPRTMKPSGVEWIGDIPKEWHRSRVGLHYHVVLGKMLCNTQQADDYTLEPYYCAADIHFGSVDAARKEMWFSPEEKDTYRVMPGDLLVVEGGAGAGGCAIVKASVTATYIQNSIMIVRGKSTCSVAYLGYWIESLVKRAYIDVVCNKATIPHFTKDKLSSVPIPLPSAEEQQEIATYLDTKCAEIDRIIEKKEQLIEELRIYKKSLIYEYVTGKREVTQK